MYKKAFIMTKLPHAGINKRRLSKDIDNTKIKRLLLNNIENCKRIFLHKKNVEFYYYLRNKENFRSFSFSHNKNFVLQTGIDLGKKIWNLKIKIKTSFVIFGSDIPNINFFSIRLAFNILKRHEIVIGPSHDGGFWLIGFANRKKMSYPFKKIRWSTQHTLTDLLINLKQQKISYDFTEKLRDIDILDDYCNYKKGFK